MKSLLIVIFPLLWRPESHLGEPLHDASAELTISPKDAWSGWVP